MLRQRALGLEILAQGRIMLDTAPLGSIAQQMMSGNTVDINGKPVPVHRTSRHRLSLAFARPLANTIILAIQS